MHFVDFKSSLQDKIQPVYIISGKEFYLVNNALNNLISACNISVPEMNISYVDSSTTLDEIFVMCETLPFLSQKRMIIAKNYTPLDSNAQNKIIEYLQAYNATTCLVFTSVTLIENASIPCVNCDYLPQNTLQSKIISEAKKLGYEIQLPALNKLIDFCASSITSCMHELDKLVAFCNNNKTITLSDVEQVCCKIDLDANIFELTDAISKKDNSTALAILAHLIKEENTKTIVSMLYNYYRRMFFALANKNRKDEQLATYLGVKPFAIKIAREQAKAIGAEKIMGAMDMLKQIDTATKSSFTSLEQELYLFLFYTLS